MRAIQPGDRLGDRFVVERLLGEGGIARVYKVHHARLGSVHAVKLLMLPKETLRDRLLLEGRIQAQLRHPNLVIVNDIIEHDGRLGLVMEYVEGTNLLDHLAHTGMLPVHEALQLFTPVLSAVATAHDVGVLHRDLKPANILLERAPGGLVPKVSDFGIARVAIGGMRESKTGMGELMGTPGYMSPEQVEGDTPDNIVDRRADIFALGAILYEMLCGERAFQGDTAFQVLRATIEGSFTPIDDLLPECPLPVRQAIDIALSEDPNDRFADCHAFADALLQGRPALRGQVRRSDDQILPGGFRPPMGAFHQAPDIAGVQSATAVPDAQTPDGLPLSVGGPVGGQGLQAISEVGPTIDGVFGLEDTEFEGLEGFDGIDGLGRSPRSISPSDRESVGPSRLALERTLDEGGPSLGAPFVPGPAAGVAYSDDEELDRPRRRRGLRIPAALVLLAGAALCVWLVVGVLSEEGGLTEEADEVGDPVGSPDEEAAVVPPAPKSPARASTGAPAASTAARPTEAPAAEVPPPELATEALPTRPAAAPEPAAEPTAEPIEPATAPTDPATEPSEPAAEPEPDPTVAETAETPDEPDTPVGPETADSPAVADSEPSDEPLAAIVVDAPPEPPALVGKWVGTANGRPLTLSLTSQDGNRLAGTVTVALGPQERVARVSGTVDGVSRRLVLAEAGGMEMRFVGVLAGSGVMGQFTAKGQDSALAWSATRQ